MNDALISQLAIAPMIDWTYSYFRRFMRILAPKSLLYTEMQTSGAIVNNPERSIGYHSMEHPLALQLGGADKTSLVVCAKLAEQRGFFEVNLNLGCPSDRVQSGHFGACLMKEPFLVAECIAAMKQNVTIPVTAKLRIGVDLEDSYEFFSEFVQQLIQAGCDKIIVHARKAWLNGLSPKQNRTIPPLHYDYVYRIKRLLSDIPVVINGNITQIDEVFEHLTQVDGVMLGRLAYQNPYMIARIHEALYPEIPLITRCDALALYIDSIASAVMQGVSMSILIKPILNLAHSLPGSRLWKEQLMQAQRTASFNELRHSIHLMRELEDC